MNLKSSLIIVAPAIAGMLMSGCKSPESIAFNATPYKHNAYGELPLLPKNQTIEPGQFFPMSSDAGILQIGRTKRATALTIGGTDGKDKLCPIAEGVEIVVVALVKTKGDEKLAIVQIKDPCVPKGVSPEVAEANRIFEGYLPLEDITVTGADSAAGDLSTVSSRVIDGINAQNIGGVAGGDPKTILAGGNAEAIKQVLKADYANPSGADYRSFLHGCIAVEQGKLPGPNKTIAGCGSNGKIANSMLNCAIPGNNFRAAKTNLVLGIYGKADAWRISPRRGAAPGVAGTVAYKSTAAFGTSSGLKEGQYNTTSSMTDRVIPASESEVHSNGINFVQIDRLIDNPNNWRATQGYFIVQGINKSGVNIGSPCIHSFTIASPVVLDLSKSQRAVRTIDKIGQKVKFDLNADGIKEETGWVYPYMGFLARDWNGNGIIDNGSELFGEYSKSRSGTKFTHGYQALSLLDIDKNGRLDSRDKEFSDLLVWVDANMDGISQKSELRSLKSHGIDRLDVVAESLPAKAGELNQVLYQSKYYGPAHCAKKGCASYDIFFGTSTSGFQSADLNSKLRK